MTRLCKDCKHLSRPWHSYFTPELWRCKNIYDPGVSAQSAVDGVFRPLKRKPTIEFVVLKRTTNWDFCGPSGNQWEPKDE